MYLSAWFCAFVMVNNTNNDEKIRCVNCDNEIDLGADVLVIEEGVLGPRGFIPLEKRLFCSQQCLSEYVCNDDLEEVPRRVP